MSSSAGAATQELHTHLLTLWQTPTNYNSSNNYPEPARRLPYATQLKRSCTQQITSHCDACNMQGINTVVITVTILKGTGIITNGYNASHAPSQDETFSSPPIDFYFFMTSNETHDSRPSADFKLNNCAPDCEHCSEDLVAG